MSNVYIVDYWLPFPSSEYGGLDIFIAESHDEVIQYYLNDVCEYNRESYPDYAELIADSVHRCKVIPMGVSQPFSFVESFRT
jgi:hypothetical protein